MVLKSKNTLLIIYKYLYNKLSAFEISIKMKI